MVFFGGVTAIIFFVFDSGEVSNSLSSEKIELSDTIKIENFQFFQKDYDFYFVRVAALPFLSTFE